MNFPLIYQCNAIFTSTAQKIASVCYQYNNKYSGASVYIDYKFTSQTINDAFTAAGYASSIISLFTWQFECSANFTVKVNSVSNCNLYFSTETYSLLTLSQKDYKEGKTGGEYSYSFSSSGTNRINVYMLPSINDLSQKMTANYTVTLADWGYSISNPYAATGLTIRNGTSTIWNNNSSSNSESNKESLSTIDIVLIATISLMFLLISLAFLLLIVVMLIMNHKLRAELRGYNLQPKKDEREEIEIQKPTNEERQNTDSLVNIEFGP